MRSVIRIRSSMSRRGPRDFLFSGEALNQRVGRLSGGERARVLIAQLMLQPADVLLLDEPTNDLDIPTLEILEESLLEYRGALILVTHDRYMLDRVSTVVLGLDGLGHAERFADYSQWAAWQRSRLSTARSAAAPESQRQNERRAQLSLPARKKFRIRKLANFRPSNSASPMPKENCKRSTTLCSILP